MIRVYFVFPYFTPNFNSLTVWIWVLIGFSILVQGSYGLKCYKCAHQNSTEPPPPQRQGSTRVLQADETCINPGADNAKIETCTSAEETCEKRSRHLRQKDKYYIVLTRGCASFFDKGMNGCQAVNEGYQANSNNYIERQKWKGWSSKGISCRCNTHDLCNNQTGIDIPSSMLSSASTSKIFLRAVPFPLITITHIFNFFLKHFLK